MVPFSRSCPFVEDGTDRLSETSVEIYTAKYRRRAQIFLSILYTSYAAVDRKTGENSNYEEEVSVTYFKHFNYKSHLNNYSVYTSQKTPRLFVIKRDSLTKQPGSSRNEPRFH
jgi:hypothetical protein